MKWFLDTEFDENGTTIKLISIALVSERGDEYYRCLLDGWHPDDCDKWVHAHVLNKLPARIWRNPKTGVTAPNDAYWAKREQVAQDLRVLMLCDVAPEVWGYFADYDWVAVCQLFGKMIDLPKGMPMYCRDLKQLMDERGFKKDELPHQAGAMHDALADARWARDAWLYINSFPVETDGTCK